MDTINDIIVYKMVIGVFPYLHSEEKMTMFFDCSSKQVTLLKITRTNRYISFFVKNPQDQMTNLRLFSAGPNNKQG